MNPHKPKKTGLSELLNSFMRNRKLIYKMAKREVLGRYRGSILGLAWSFFNPLLMLVIYTFFFSVVVKTRWGGGAPGNDLTQSKFAVVLFSGLIIHGLFSECINRAPTLITSNISYVKKVVFPLEILPWVGLSSALFHAGISVSVLLLIQLIMAGKIALTAIIFPIVVLPLLVLTIGVMWVLSAIGVYVRDIAQITVMISSVLLFISPVFFPLSGLSPKLQSIAIWNPLTLIIEESRKVLILNEWPNWTYLATYLGLAILIAWAGFWWFQKVRKGFADVL